MVFVFIRLGGWASMVALKEHVRRTGVRPVEGDPPLSVDPDGKALAHRVEVVGRRNVEVFDPGVPTMLTSSVSHGRAPSLRLADGVSEGTFTASFKGPGAARVPLGSPLAGRRRGWSTPLPVPAATRELAHANQNQWVAPITWPYFSSKVPAFILRLSFGNSSVTLRSLRGELFVLPR